MIWLNVYSPSSSPGHWTFTCVRAESRLFWKSPVYVEGGGRGHVPAPGCGPRVSMVTAPPGVTDPISSNETAGHGKPTTAKPLNLSEPGSWLSVIDPEQFHDPA